MMTALSPSAAPPHSPARSPRRLISLLPPPPLPLLLLLLIFVPGSVLAQQPSPSGASHEGGGAIASLPLCTDFMSHVARTTTPNVYETLLAPDALLDPSGLHFATTPALHEPARGAPYKGASVTRRSSDSSSGPLSLHCSLERTALIHRLRQPPSARDAVRAEGGMDAPLRDAYHVLLGPTAGAARRPVASSAWPMFFPFMDQPHVLYGGRGPDSRAEKEGRDPVDGEPAAEWQDDMGGPHSPGTESSSSRALMHSWAQLVSRQYTERLGPRLRWGGRALRAFPWTDRLALCRLFQRRTIRLSFPVGEPFSTGVTSTTAPPAASSSSSSSSGPAGEASTAPPPPRRRLSRAEAFSAGSLSMVRVVSYPATPYLPRKATAAAAAIDSSSTATTRREADEDAAWDPQQQQQQQHTMDGHRYYCDVRTVQVARALVEQQQRLRADEEERRAFYDPYGPDAGPRDGAYADEDADLIFEDGGAGWGRGMRYQRHATRQLQQGSPLVWRLLRQLFQNAVQLLFGSSSSTPSSSSSSAYGTEGRRGALPLTRAALAAEAYAARVREELGPYQDTAASHVPSALSQLLGRRALEATRSLLLITTTAPTSNGRHPSGRSREVRRTAQYHLELRLSLPAAEVACLAVLGIAPSTSEMVRYAHSNGAAGETERMHPSLEHVALEVEEDVSFDGTWLRLFALFLSLRFVQPRLEDSKLFQFVFAAVCGLFFILLLALLYVARELQKMTIGRMGVAVVLFAGGASALGEGLLSALYYLFSQLYVDPVGATATSASEAWLIGLCVFFAVGAVCSVVVRWLVPASFFRTGIRAGLYGCLALSLLSAWARNAEATAIALVLHAVLRDVCGGGQSVLGQCTVVCCAPLRSLYSAWGAAYTAGNDPVREDQLPAHAREARGYTRPLAANAPGGASGGGGGMSAEARMEAYEAEGAAHTRRALAELAARVRSDPAVLTGRLRHPQEVKRWAEAYQ